MKFVRTCNILTHHLKQFLDFLIYYKNIVQYFYNSQLDKKLLLIEIINSPKRKLLNLNLNQNYLLQFFEKSKISLIIPKSSLEEVFIFL